MATALSACLEGMHRERDLTQYPARLFVKELCSHSRQLSVGTFTGGWLFLRTSAKPLLEGAGIAFRRGCVPQSIDEKKAFLQIHGIALWDVIASCEIVGSSDASIRNAVPNDLSRILEVAPIRGIFTNGATADRLYRKYLCDRVGMSATCLPSTSPANAAWTQARLEEAWRVILDCLQKGDGQL